MSDAKEYTLKLLLDKDAADLREEILQESQAVFFKNDTLFLESTLCKQNCPQTLKQGFDVAVFSASKKQKSKKTYIINYDKIRSSYDKKRVVKATALAIYEYLKEKKVKTVFIKTAPMLFEKEQISTTSGKILGFEDLAILIKQNNHDYQYNQNSVKLESLNVEKSKSHYRPKVTLFANHRKIDEDRARYSQGRHPEDRTTTGISVKQLLFSNKAHQNIKISKLLYDSKQEGTEASNDELLYEAMSLYLAISKAKEQKAILASKKTFIKKNLHFAKQRVDISVNNRSDIYRWQTELAQINTQLSNAKQQLKELKYQLFMMLGIQEDYDFKKYDTNSSFFKLLSNDAIEYIQKQEVQELFSKIATKQYPGLQKLKKALNAKQEQITMNKREFYLPTLAFEGRYKKHISEKGAGSDVPVQWNDEEFEAMITLRFDLFDSSLKEISLKKSMLERQNLQLSYSRLKDEIDKNLSTSYYFLEQAYQNIQFAKAAYKASQKNLDLTQDRYSHDKANIISLLEVQNNLTTAKRNHTMAVTEYLQTLVSIYFFIGKIDVLTDQKTKTTLENKIKTHLHKGVQ
ncbi:MAG: TolC family protein [Campylobacterales bacterium]